MSAVGFPDIRSLILGLQDDMMRWPNPIEPSTVHHFVRKCYIRECRMPRGSIFVGKIHKYETFNIILSGDVTVLSEHHGMVRMIGPFIFISQPGAKRVVYNNENTVWLTVHPTEKTNLEEIEEEFIAKDYTDPALVDVLSKFVEAA